MADTALICRSQPGHALLRSMTFECVVEPLHYASRRRNSSSRETQSELPGGLRANSDATETLQSSERIRKRSDAAPEAEAVSSDQRLRDTVDRDRVLTFSKNHFGSSPARCGETWFDQLRRVGRQSDETRPTNRWLWPETTASRISRKTYPSRGTASIDKPDTAPSMYRIGLQAPASPADSA